MWYDLNKTLSYNCLFNFIVGNRGSGKTYNAKKWVIRGFLKNGSQFVYVRRYKEELKNNDKFFDDIRDEFPDVEFEVRGFLYLINGQVAGTAIPLSTSRKEKSTPYPVVDKVIFDEFIIEKGVYHYLSSEVICFLELYETIARTRNNVKVFFLSNALTITNPYFIYFNLSLPYGKNVICKNDMLLQLVQDEEFIAAKKKTRFGKIISDTDYARYSIDNKFLLDNTKFIKRKTPTARYYFTIHYMDVPYGIYIDYVEGLMFVSTDVDMSCRISYSLTMADHSPNTMLLKGTKTALFQKFIDEFKASHVRFENVQIKNMILEVIKITL
jgi:hypothetical protein